ncbi:WecB/TagA/CpsF family glycosyltransferase [Halothermothrix orenii]|uniref:N-acetylglucosaminyldiphosphoundecaprenol N-acetyl-beta-D-mannosaminyltransferase n=1 Tax=Halothermothrix orenii (strain H 168 / OCM 544 / DSM 9562) TaxID=373903 RepID=B8CYL9_HALOH|nr:WecB/TagA/CpsF family glycosyltransferase [Halothermothrix orenii]ACL70388.1 glycosyl transferase, WecB/TagA/CpsF family [Halothermothrix orenii H 168]
MVTGNRVDILGIKVDNVSMGEAISKVVKYIEEGGRCRLIVTPNSEIIVRARRDSNLAHILNMADLTIPDGAGVVLASRLIKPALKERVAGFDLMKELLKEAASKGLKVFFLGGKQEVIKKAVANIEKKYPGLKISGYHHGYLNKELENKVIGEINTLKPHLIFVGMGVPRQEEFLYNNLTELKAGVAMTVGGSFDILAGNLKRAPRWMQKNHLEWLYRLRQEPKRIIRMMALPRFVYLVFKKYLKDRL